MIKHSSWLMGQNLLRTRPSAEGLWVQPRACAHTLLQASLRTTPVHTILEYWLPDSSAQEGSVELQEMSGAYSQPQRRGFNWFGMRLGRQQSKELLGD